MTLPEFVYTVVLKPKPLRAAANASLRALTPAKKRLGNAWWALNPNDPVVSGAATLGLYEGTETALFQKICRPGMTFLDIGANSGYYSAWAISLMKNSGRILSVEPDPDAIRHLEATRDLNKCSFMSVLPFAASDRSGEAQLFRNRDNRGDNRLYANDLCAESIAIRCEPVDSLLSTLGVSSVDLIKIDVQGFEGHVLRGMANTLRNSPRLAMLMEFWPWGLAQANSDAVEVLGWLEDLGFVIFELVQGGMLQPLTSHKEFVQRLPGRKYTNIVCFRNTGAKATQNLEAISA